MDNGIGEIVQALKDSGMWDNTFLLFMSDHGACTVRECWDNVGGNNAPWRGGKFTLFDGGLKSAAFIHAPWLSNTGSIKELMHVTDLLPTLLSIADSDHTADSGTCDVESCSASSQPVDIDGVDLSDMFLGHGAGRESLIVNLARHPIPAGNKYRYYCRWCDLCDWSDCPTLPESYTGVRYKNYKLLEGHDAWCSSSLLESPPCPPLTPYLNTTVMLFDLTNDPDEMTNIADEHPELVKVMMELVREEEKRAVTNFL